MSAQGLGCSSPMAKVRGPPPDPVAMEEAMARHGCASPAAKSGIATRSSFASGYGTPSMASYLGSSAAATPSAASRSSPLRDPPIRSGHRTRDRRVLLHRDMEFVGFLPGAQIRASACRSICTLQCLPRWHSITGHLNMGRSIVHISISSMAARAPHHSLLYPVRGCRGRARGLEFVSEAAIGVSKPEGLGNCISGPVRNWTCG